MKYRVAQSIVKLHGARKSSPIAVPCLPPLSCISNRHFSNNPKHPRHRSWKLDVHPISEEAICCIQLVVLIRMHHALHCTVDQTIFLFAKEAKKQCCTCRRMKIDCHLASEPLDIPSQAAGLLKTTLRVSGAHVASFAFLASLVYSELSDPATALTLGLVWMPLCSCCTQIHTQVDKRTLKLAELHWAILPTSSACFRNHQLGHVAPPAYQTSYFSNMLVDTRILCGQ